MMCKLGLLMAAAVFSLPLPVAAQSAAAAGEITYSKDIAPILQRSCENCHRADGVAPMSLVTYEEVRPWARAIKQRTGIGPRAGVMPPWYVEKNIGIQKYKNDPSLSDEEIAKIAQVGRQRRAARQPRRHAAAQGIRRRQRVDDRHARPHRQDCTDIIVKGERARLVGRDSDASPTGLDRRSLRRGARDQGSQRRRRPAATGARRSAAATSSTT